MGDEIIAAIPSLLGTIIGILGSYCIAKQQIKRDVQKDLREKRSSVYLQALEFIQDYQTHRKNNKKYDISDEELHNKLYCLLAKINIYGSNAVIKAFNQAKKNIESNKDDKEFTKLSEAIRKDLDIN